MKTRPGFFLLAVLFLAACSAKSGPSNEPDGKSDARGIEVVEGKPDSRNADVEGETEHPYSECADPLEIPEYPELCADVESFACDVNACHAVVGCEGDTVHFSWELYCVQDGDDRHWDFEQAGQCEYECPHGCSVGEYRDTNFPANFQDFVDSYCLPECQPDCEGKECGDDGCGGSCGDCDDEDICTEDSCEDFQCVNEVVDPSAFCCLSDTDCQATTGLAPCFEPICSIEPGDAAGVCEAVPIPGCCPFEDPTYLLVEDFQSGALPAGWQGDAAAGSAVKWHVSEIFSCNDCEQPLQAQPAALRFGFEDGPGYDCGQPYCWGTVTTSSMVLPASSQAYVEASFCLSLGTEWDETPPGAYVSLGIDTLYVRAVAADGELFEVWSSDAVKGTTHGDCVPVCMDLTQFGGQEISLQFTFSSGDVIPSNNDHFGALIDNLAVKMTCQKCCL